MACVRQAKKYLDIRNAACIIAFSYLANYTRAGFSLRHSAKSGSIFRVFRCPPPRADQLFLTLEGNKKMVSGFTTAATSIPRVVPGSSSAIIVPIGPRRTFEKDKTHLAEKQGR